MENKPLKKFVVTLLLLFGSTASAFASLQAVGQAAVKTNDGYVVVWNQPDIHFTLNVKGKQVRPLNATGTGSIAFAVDGVVLQVQSVAVSEFLKNAKKQKLSDQAILMAHQNWEVQYLKQTLGTEINVTTLPPQPASGVGETLLWKFAMPKNKAQQIYLTVVSGKQVVILNGTLEGKAPVADSTIQRLLLDTLSTLRASSRPIDITELQESIRRGHR